MAGWLRISLCSFQRVIDFWKIKWAHDFLTICIQKISPPLQHQPAFLQMFCFMDNRRNCDIDNLMLVTKADNAVMNRWYSGSSPEYRQATLAMAQIKLAITRRQRDTK